MSDAHPSQRHARPESVIVIEDRGLRTTPDVLRGLDAVGHSETRHPHNRSSA